MSASRAWSGWSNATWEREAAGGGLFAALTAGRGLSTAGAALGLAPDLLPDLVDSARARRSEPFGVSIPGPAGSPGWVYRLRCASVAHGGRGALLTCRDVTLQRQTDLRLRYEATHDRLTGMADRDLLLSEIAALLRRGGSQRHLLMYVDVDGLKQVNDVYGHGEGDAVLREVARRMARTGRGDVVARVGGDDFAFLAVGAGDADVALGRAKELHALLTQPYVVRGRPLQLTVSIGCRTTRLRPSETAESVLGDADEAMHQAKKAGKNGVALYSAELHERSTAAPPSNGRWARRWAPISCTWSISLRCAWRPDGCSRSRRCSGGPHHTWGPCLRWSSCQSPRAAG